jgi:very-short-patch-repair endonuclease
MRYPRSRKPRTPRKLTEYQRLLKEAEAHKWEDLLLAQLRQEGLPEPEREYKFAKSIKRLWRADFAYPTLKILIECEGGGTRGRHLRYTGYREDCVKYSWASILGFTLIRATGDMIETGEALQLIQAAFKRASRTE